MITEHLDTFAGLPVVEFDGERGAGDGLPAASAAAWAVRCFVHENGAQLRDLQDNFPLFLEAVDTAEVTHLVIGWWEYEEDPIELLIGVADRFPSLRALFLGDIVDGERHISWIEQFDLTPLFAAFPLLEHLEVRGGEGLRFTPMRNELLKVLRFESGGLPASAVQSVTASDLPALEHLDLWLGADERGRSVTVPNLGPILTGERLPALRRLGLQNADCQDEIAEAVATASVVARLESLALSMGALTDRGAEALLNGQPLTHLKELDLHHAFLSDAVADRLKAALPGVRVDLDDAIGEPGWLDNEIWDDSGSYIAVAE
ncbi:STM4015 family protein [Spirillospora sp. NBC_01491]|uniref:STM4015 family protein n=1 Tax=Spirillospora sp. NBC_01491 TaxID=2976007 RepID=UPI002E30F505|nr:STM4015 family protein [Spirillospora sp. NBC_01491]